MERIEQIAEWLKHCTNESEMIFAWNEMCYDECRDNHIFANNDEFFKCFFANKSAREVARAICYGEYDYDNKYVTMRDNGTLVSFDTIDAPECPIEVNEIAEWLDKNNGYYTLDTIVGYAEIFDNDNNDND